MVLANHLRQTLLEPLKERQRMEGFEEGFAKGYEEGFAEGYAKGFKEGIEMARAEMSEGYAIGVALSDTAWRAWLERREKAKASGMPFDEPPPNLGG